MVFVLFTVAVVEVTHSLISPFFGIISSFSPLTRYSVLIFSFSVSVLNNPPSIAVWAKQVCIRIGFYRKFVISINNPPSFGFWWNSVVNVGINIINIWPTRRQTDGWICTSPVHIQALQPNLWRRMHCARSHISQLVVIILVCYFGFRLSSILCSQLSAALDL